MLVPNYKITWNTEWTWNSVPFNSYKLKLRSKINTTTKWKVHNAKAFSNWLNLPLSNTMSQEAYSDLIIATQWTHLERKNCWINESNLAGHVFQEAHSVAKSLSCQVNPLTGAVSCRGCHTAQTYHVILKCTNLGFILLKRTNPGFCITEIYKSQSYTTEIYYCSSYIKRPR